MMNYATRWIIKKETHDAIIGNIVADYKIENVLTYEIDKSGNLWARQARGIDPQESKYMKGGKIQVGDVMDRSVYEKKEQIIADPYKDDRSSISKIKLHKGSPFVVIPFIVNSRPIGMVSFNHKNAEYLEGLHYPLIKAKLHSLLKEYENQILVSPSLHYREYEIGKAQTPKELLEIYKLRKEVYVDEFQYCEDTGAEYLVDKYDDYSHNYYIKYKGEAVGTARLTSEDMGEIELSKDIRWEKYLRKDRKYCEITRFIFRPEHRNAFATFIMLKYIYEMCIMSGINAIVMGSEVKSKAYFQNIGFTMLEEAEFRVASFRNSPEYRVYYTYFDDRVASERFKAALVGKLNTEKDIYNVNGFKIEIY
jgi:N-acyl-L-homoserine lactone synthetase